MNERQRRRTMILSIRDGSAWTVMEKFATEYLAAFVVALGFVGQQLSMLLTIPLGATAVLQLVSQSLITRYGRLRVICDAVMFQTVTIALIIVSAFLVPFTSLLPVLIVLITVYYATNAVAGNAWISLMGDLVPERSRARFFAARSRVIESTGVLALVSAGIVVSVLEPRFGPIVAFSSLFLVALIARVISYHYLSQWYDPILEALPQEDRFSLFDFIGRFKTSNFTRYVFFNALFWLSVFVAEPFVAYYQLEVLGFSYIEYTAIKLVFIIAGIVSLKRLALVCDEYGNRFVFFASAFVIALSAGARGVLTSFGGFVLIELVSGIGWAAFNLSTVNFIFDSVASKKRTLVNSYIVTLRGTAILIGGSISAYALFVAQTIERSLPHNEYQLLFFLTAGMRIILVLIFLPLVREVRSSVRPSTRNLVHTHVGSKTKQAINLTLMDASNPFRYVKRRIERFEEDEVDEALDVDERSEPDDARS